MRRAHKRGGAFMDLYRSKNADEWRNTTAHDVQVRTQGKQEQKQQLSTFKTSSEIEVPDLTTEEDLSNFNPREQLGYPGEFPYTRGIHPGMYRSRLWTMRQ